MADPGLKKRVLSNLLSNYLAGFLGMVLGFLLVPFLIRKLGREGFGLTVLAESTIMFCEILTVSVRIALSRHATFSYAQGKLDEFAEYLSTGRVLALVSAALVFVMALGIGLNFSHFFKVSEAYVVPSEALFLLIATGFCLSIPNIVYWSVLYAHQRFDLINTAMASGLIVRALLLFAAYSWLPERFITLYTYGFIYLGMTLFQNTMVYWWHKRLMPELKLTFAKYRRSRVREILSFSAHTSLGRLSALLYDNTANIIVNEFWGAVANTTYSVALRIPLILKRLFIETSWTLTPTFTDLVARGERDRVERLLFTFSKVISLFTMPLGIGVILFGGPLLQMWVGPGFEESVVLMRVLTAPLILLLPLSVNGCIATAYAKVSVPSKVSFGLAIVNVILGIALGRWMGLGLLGIALAAASCSFIYSVLFVTVYTCRLAGISVTRYVFVATGKPLMATVAVFGAMYALWRNVLGQPVLFSAVFLSLSAVFTVLYGLVAYWLLLSDYERKHFSDMLRPLLNYVGFIRS